MNLLSSTKFRDVKLKATNIRKKNNNNHLLDLKCMFVQEPHFIVNTVKQRPSWRSKSDPTSEVVIIWRVLQKNLNGKILVE